MKVTIRRAEEKEGMLFKKPIHVLYVAVELSPEETEAVEAAGVGDYILLEYEHKGLELNHTVRMLLHMKGRESRFVAYSAPERAQMEEQMKEGLVALKSVIENSQMKESEESFEL